MTKEQLIKFLRSSVHVQDPEINNDSKYLSLTDEDLELYLTVALSRDSSVSKGQSLDSLTDAQVYPLLLLAKKELYYALAVIEAPLYDMGADNNNYLKRTQRFEHYMKLIAQVDEEFNKYNEEDVTGTNNTLTTYDVLLSNRYYTKRYRSKCVVPVCSLYADEVRADSVDLSWDCIINNFIKAEIYVSTSPIYDPYNVENHISPDAQLVFLLREYTEPMCRITDLGLNTKYFICLVVTDRTGLKGYSQIEIDTTPVVEDPTPEEPPTDPTEPTEGTETDGGSTDNVEATDGGEA